MKTTVDLYDFRREFAQCRPDNFSYEGLSILFDYLEELGDGCGEEIELDVIALCCDFLEASPKEIADAYGIELDPDDDTEVNFDKVFAYLADHTSVIGHTDTTIVYQNF